MGNEKWILVGMCVAGLLYLWHTHRQWLNSGDKKSVDDRAQRRKQLGMRRIK